MTASEITSAAELTLAQRASDYDKPEGERSMEKVIPLFNTLTGHSLTVTDGWQLMVLLKLVRGRTGPGKADSFIDGAAYFALAGESSLKSSKP